MDGSEDKRVTQTDEEPPWLRAIRNARSGFDLIFPPVVALVALGSFPVILLNPELQNPQSIGLVSGVLLALAGAGFRKKGGS